MRRYDEDVEVRCAPAGQLAERLAAGRTGAGVGVGARVGSDAADMADAADVAVDVAAPAAPAGVVELAEPNTPIPDAFVRGGRLYVVRAVLDRWVERRPWWRTVLDDAAAGRTPALGPAELEDPAWRVEAAPGRLAEVGVYDLIGRPGGPWRLRRVSD